MIKVVKCSFMGKYCSHQFANFASDLISETFMHIKSIFVRTSNCKMYQINLYEINFSKKFSSSCPQRLLRKALKISEEAGICEKWRFCVPGKTQNLRQLQHQYSKKNNKKNQRIFNRKNRNQVPKLWQLSINVQKMGHAALFSTFC